MQGIKDRVFVILGAGQGIGKATAAAFNEAGGRLVCVDRDPDLANAVAREVNGLALSADVTDRQQVKALFQRAAEWAGAPLAGVADIVGIADVRPFLEFDDAAWERQFGTVLRHVFLTLQEATPYMGRGSSFTFVSSMSGERMLSSTSLIGRKVAVADAFAQLSEDGTLKGSIDLPLGASGIQLNVYDQRGNLVQELSAGPQTPGTTPVTWDGKDAMGNPVPPGLYRFKAKAVVNGATTDVAVNTMSTVRSVASGASDGVISLELDGGKSVLLSEIKRFGM